MTGLSRQEAGERSRLLDVSVCEVHFDFASEPDRVRSRSLVRFACFEPGASSFAQLSALEVLRIVLNGEELDPRDVVAGDRVALSGLGADNELLVESVHGYSTDGRGFLQTTDALTGEAYVMAYSYPTYAPRMFCCFDQPDFAPFLRLSVTVPAGMECASHSPADDRRRSGESDQVSFAGLHRVKAHELTAFCGPYGAVVERPRSVDGAVPSTRILCRPSLGSGAELDKVADLATAAIAHYGELFGVPSPYESLDIAFAPDLAPLAVLVPGLMGLNESLLHRVSDDTDDFVKMVVGHEVAHLWFGCLVDCKWWDDLWLAEALATWASYEIGDSALKMRSPWAGFVMTESQRAYDADRLPTAQAVGSRVESAEQATARPSAITYAKGASVVRQLGALVGDEALRQGLVDYLGRSRGTATLDEAIGSFAGAAGRDLSGWSDDWLRQRGVNLLRPVIEQAQGHIASLAVRQEPSELDGAGTLRTHRLSIGLYEEAAGALRRARSIEVEVAGPETTVGDLAGEPLPAAVIVNDTAVAYSRLRFDEKSLSALIACDMDLGDDVAEAVCWSSFYDMVTSGELSAERFVAVVARRLARPGLPAAAGDLASWAVAAASLYGPPRERESSRAALCAAYEGRLLEEDPTTRQWRELAHGAALSAETQAQLDRLREWLDGGLPDGRAYLDLRREALKALATRGRVNERDLSAFAELDPVGGEATSATCRALRPDPAAKRAAFEAALAAGQPPRLAAAHAGGIWVEGQEAMAPELCERFFTEALDVLSRMARPTAGRVGALLYPRTIVSMETIDATDEALARTDLSEAAREVLVEQRALLLRVMAARAA